MQVILLEAVENLGKLGETVKVRPGHARNYLIPQGKATAATPENLAAFEARRAELERQQADTEAAARARAAQLEGIEVTIPGRTAEEGRLYGSVGTHDVAEAVTAAGVPVEKHEIRLHEGPIRQIGDYEVSIHLYADIDATVTVHVVPEGA